MTVFGSRKGWLVSSIAVADRHVLVSCPELAEVHSMMSWWDNKSGQVLDNRLAAGIRNFCIVHVENWHVAQAIAWALLTIILLAGERRMACQAG